MAVGDIYKLHLETIVAGGDALGRIDGKTIFVEGGAPDEIAVCRITKDNNTWARAQILEIVKPSINRTESRCVFSNKCGGCNLSHIDYNAQLAAKKNILNNLLLHAEICAEREEPEIKIFASQEFEYRNRVQFHCLKQRGNYGFKVKKSGEVITVKDCQIAVSGIRNVIKEGLLEAPPEKDRFTVFFKDDVLLCEGSKSRGKIKLLGKEIIVDAGVFFQSNCLMLEKLIIELQKISDDADKNLLMADFYCGVGTFGVFLAEKFSKIICAEENKTAVSIARENIKGVNAEFFALRDSEWQRAVFHQKNKIGFAVIDPPRAGLNNKFAAILTKENIPILAYVSCDPASLSRDSKILINGGYKLKDLMLFDFYPQTSHIESLAVFEKF